MDKKYIYLLLLLILIILTINVNFNKKTLVTYVYFENERAKKNLTFFIKNGIFDKNDVIYNIVIKGETCSIEFPRFKNINIIKTKNEGYDFAGYSKSVSNINIKDFKYFIFLNDTSLGPFIPRYINKDNWYNFYTRLLSDKIKLIGGTINKKKYIINNYTFLKHVQSNSFATDIVGLNLLIKNKILNEKNNIDVLKKKGKRAFINNFEINMSQVIINNGYQIASLTQTENNKTEVRYGDIHKNNKYFGVTLNPMEIMFIKNNRINSKYLNNYIKWNS